MNVWPSHTQLFVSVCADLDPKPSQHLIPVLFLSPARGLKSPCLRRCGHTWSRQSRRCLCGPQKRGWSEWGNPKANTPTFWSPPWMSTLSSGNPVTPWRWEVTWIPKAMALRRPRGPPWGKSPRLASLVLLLPTLSQERSCRVCHMAPGPQCKLSGGLFLDTGGPGRLQPPEIFGPEVGNWPGGLGLLWLSLPLCSSPHLALPLQVC